MANRNLATNLPKLLANIKVGAPKKLKAILNFYTSTEEALESVSYYKGPTLHSDYQKCAVEIYAVLKSQLKKIIGNELGKLFEGNWPKTVEAVDTILDEVNNVSARLMEWFDETDEHHEYVVALLMGQEMALQRGFKGQFVPPRTVPLAQIVDYLSAYISTAETARQPTENQESPMVESPVWVPYIYIYIYIILCICV